MQPCYPLRAHRTAAVCLLKPILGLLIFIVAPLLLSPAAALAQTPGGSGSITGRVQNVTSGSYLNNARVRVLGTNLEAFTNSSGDRKSTRLNSSHQIISYAVFCLKKKQ